MTRQAIVRESNSDQDSLGPRTSFVSWMSALLGSAPTAFALLATWFYGGHWASSLRLPTDFLWVNGVISMLVLSLVFVLVAIAIELRRSNILRLVEEMAADDARIDEDLWDASQSVHRLRAMGVMDGASGDG